MKYFRIRKQEEFQHYKNRNPPWIMLHLRLFGSQRFLRLSDAQKWHALSLALIASRYDNHLPDNPKWLQEETHSKAAPSLGPLFEAKFLEWCSCAECAADCSNLQQDAAHRRGEDTKAKQRRTSVQNENGFKEFWVAYPRKQGKRNAQKAFDQAKERGMPDTKVLVHPINQWKATKEWADPKFIPHPATWLNRDGWEDVPAGMVRR